MVKRSNITLRNGTFHLRKRVPNRFAEVEQRKEIWLSLKTDSRVEAETRAEEVWRETLDAWESALAGDPDQAEKRFACAKATAQRLGFRYMPMDSVVKLPPEDLIARVNASFTRSNKPILSRAKALLGNATPPKVTIMMALDMYWSLAEDQTLGKSPDQIRRWRSPHIKAFRFFVCVNGDLPLDQISRDHMLDFREALWRRINAGEIKPSTANDDMIHFTSTIRKVDRFKRLGLELPFGDLNFKNQTKSKRPPFSSAWITEKWLAPGALMALEPEARGVLLGMVNTGYRPSEGKALTSKQIVLDQDMPYIEIVGGERKLKTAASNRIIPLAGISLEAFRENPNGFPKYRDSPSLVLKINRFLGKYGLLETEAHTLYGLRHSFEDRLLDADVDERIRRDLMGHALDRQRYGAGATRAKLFEAVAKIAL